MESTLIFSKHDWFHSTRLAKGFERDIR
jgi:hypothetical protein